MSSPETFTGIFVFKTVYRAKSGAHHWAAKAKRDFIHRGLSLITSLESFQAPLIENMDDNTDQGEQRFFVNFRAFRNQHILNWDHSIGHEPFNKNIAMSLKAPFDDIGRPQKDFDLLYDKKGKPYLKRDCPHAPSISFSYWEDEAWMALGPGDCSLGIDVAHSSEFPVDYPFDKAFSRWELILAGGVTGLARHGAAALSWSVKEAVAKAMGEGFRELNFTDIELSHLHKGSEPLAGIAIVHNWNNRAERSRLVKEVPFVSLYHADKWISIAMVKRCD